MSEREHRMNLRAFVAIFAGIYGLMGLMGFVPGITTPPDGSHDLAVDAAHGHILGIFPTNIVHNIVHIGVGLWGLAASRSWGAARFFAQANAVLFGLLTVMGLVPGLDTMFGLAPLHGADVALHAVAAIANGYFGFVHARREAFGTTRA
jgi:hypothetical protein